MSWICFAEYKQMSPPPDKETVFAAPLQGRLGFHPCSRLDAGEMLTLSWQRWPTLSRWGELDGAESGWWKQQCARSCGESVETPESTGCWWGCHIKPTHLGHLASQGGRQVLQQERCHLVKGCKKRTDTIITEMTYFDLSCCFKYNVSWIIKLILTLNVP